MRPTFLTIISLLLFALPVSGQTYRSHPPQRPLPTVSQRPQVSGPALFIDAVKGDDANDGSQQKPWKTLGQAAKHLKAGITLTLRGGTYYENAVVSASGTLEQPITIRSYPGELAILDGGLREFFEDPAGSWEKCPGGVAGEFWSRKTYPDPEATPGGVHVLGRFGDSMVPLHGYRYLSDLRSANEYWTVKVNSAEEEKGIYCGPGVWFDPKTGRIHCRLAPTTLKRVGEENQYHGESDPRQIPLVLGTSKRGPALALRNCRHLRLQDLVLRGTREPTLEIFGCTDLLLEGLTVYGGNPAVWVRDTAGLRMLHTACRGIAAPWTFRGHLKYRSIEARIFSANGWDPTGADSREFEMAYSEFTDSVDGVFLGTVHGMRFHHNLVENISDDGLFLTANTGFDGNTPGGDVHLYQNRFARCLTTLAFGVGNGRQKVTPEGRQPGAGVFVFRNVFDFRRLVHYHIPQTLDEGEDLYSQGRFAGDHGSPLWEPMTIYHNTFLADDKALYAYGTHGLATAVRAENPRRVFNNILVQMHTLPGSSLPPPTADFQGDANLHWSLKVGPGFQGDLFAKFRKKGFEESKARYGPGWTANDRFADPKFVQFDPDWRKPVDLRLQKDSPAVDAGVSLPLHWPDPLRLKDAGKPDQGALPFGAEPVRVGVRGRLMVFGDEAKIVATPVQVEPAYPASKIVSRYRDGLKPTALVRGYPGFDGPILEYTLKNRGVPVEVRDRLDTWLDTREYSKFRCVALVGDLARAKLEPNKFSVEDLPRVQDYLEKGGTLILMRQGREVFSTPEGRAFLDRLTGAGPVEKKAPAPVLGVRLPDHSWVKHLGPKEDLAWIQFKNALVVRGRNGESVIGNPGGDQSILYRLPLGKGQLIFVGWELSAWLPKGPPSMLPTVAQEKTFEGQVRILRNLVAELYP